MIRQATAFLFFVCSSALAQKQFTISSPSGDVKVFVINGDSLFYSVQVGGTDVLKNSVVALRTEKKTFGVRDKITKSSTTKKSGQIINPVPYKRKIIRNDYTELQLSFKNYSVWFRAYDDGVAYRFVLDNSTQVLVLDEIATFRFSNADSLFAGCVQKRDDADIFHTSFEESYRKITLPHLTRKELAFSPILVKGQINVIITESDLVHYPGMFLTGSGKNELSGVFAPYPKTEKIQGGGFKQRIVDSRESYIAKVSGKQQLPWRVILLAEQDKDLLTNDLVYRLGSPAKEVDWSWVKPGISTEEWICRSNLHGVDFKSGINTQTYRYYIDFASRFGMQYVMLDAGWSDYNDLTKITPGLDLEEIAAYAKSKNINLVLWTLAMTLDRQLDQAITMFKKLDVKVIMTDFMDRDDQPMVEFYHRVAEVAAENKMMVMFHGAFKNAGFERSYPNAIAREAVLGSEYNIWSEKATPEHDLLIPFIRMTSGPMDYEPGFMVNANKKTFRPLPDNVMSMGTRTHQLAMFVAYESPLQLFSGNPSDAYPEVAYTTYLASLPTTWDETIALDAKLGDYLLLARRKERDWYLVAMTDWNARELDVDLSFLGKEKFRAFTVEDGINSEKNPCDYKMGYQLVDGSTTLKIKMASGGGYVAKLVRLDDARP
jgi:alpha-glucosidase